MNGTEWIFELVDQATAPLTRIMGNLVTADTGAGKFEDSLKKVSEQSEGVHAVGTAFEEVGHHIFEAAAGFGVWTSIETVVEGITEGIKETINEVREVTEKYERFNVVLKAHYGDATKAAGAIKMIDDYVKDAPFHADELTQAFVEMQAKGFTPTIHQMHQLGDIATAYNKGFGEIMNTVEMASMGAFRGLKQLGVVMKPAKDNLKEFGEVASMGKHGHAHIHGAKAVHNANTALIATFKGQKTVIDNTEESIRNYVLSLGDAAGVQGVAKDLMSEMVGKESELVNHTEELHKLMGEGIFGDALKGWLEFKIDAVDGMIKWVEWFGEHKDDIKEAFEDIAIAIGFATVAWLGFNAAEIAGQLVAGAALLSINLLTAAEWLLNFAMDANPIGIIVALLAALAIEIKTAWEHSESFRVALFQMWEVGKAVFTGLGDLATSVFQSIGLMIKGIGEQLIGFFMIPFDHGKMFEQGMKDTAESMVIGNSAFGKMGQSITEAKARGAEEGHASFEKTGKKKGEHEGGIEGGFGESDDKKETSQIDGAGVTGAAGGGAGGGGRSIIIQKVELGSHMVIHSNDMKATAQEFRRIWDEEMMGTVRDFEVGISNG